MKFILEINLGNDAMQTAEDVESALRELADEIVDFTTVNSGTVFDINGNNVGSWRVENDKPVRRSGAERIQPYAPRRSYLR